MPKVLVSDKLSETAVQIFRDRGVEVDYLPDLGKDKEKLAAVIGQYDGLAIRSATKVTEKETRTVGKDRVTTIDGNDEADVKKKLTLKAGEQITLEVGQAKIVMKSDGTIEMSGMQIKIKGTSKVEIDGTQTAISGQQLDVKGTKTAVQGSGMLDLASSGVASLKGSLTKIG